MTITDITPENTTPQTIDEVFREVVRTDATVRDCVKYWGNGKPTRMALKLAIIALIKRERVAEYQRSVVLVPGKRKSPP